MHQNSFVNTVLFPHVKPLRFSPTSLQLGWFFPPKTAYGRISQQKRQSAFSSVSCLPPYQSAIMGSYYTLNLRQLHIKIINQSVETVPISNKYTMIPRENSSSVASHTSPYRIEDTTMASRNSHHRPGSMRVMAPPLLRALLGWPPINRQHTIFPASDTDHI